MARPDRIPSHSAAAIRKFRRAIKWAALLSVAVAAIAVVLVARGDNGVHIHMLIATALGAGLTVMLGTALMLLVFLSSWSGHDEQASRSEEFEDKE